jgi:uncharacterized protein YhbP (UPF0306 family)
VTKSEIVAAVREVIAAESTLVLSTVDTNGIVSSAPLFYLPGQNLDLYWLSSGNSRHSTNVSAHPQAAVAVHQAVWRWKEIRGVQMEGAVKLVDEPAERGWVVGQYVARFHLRPELYAAIESSALFCFRPVWVRYLDNRRGFGFSVEASL